MISQNSLKEWNQTENESSEIHSKVTDSIEKIFPTDRSDRRTSKIKMIGWKKTTSDVHSSESCERSPVILNKAALVLKTRENCSNVNLKKCKNNINKEMAKKYAGKGEIQKVNHHLFIIFRRELIQKRSLALKIKRTCLWIAYINHLLTSWIRFKLLQVT